MTTASHRLPDDIERWAAWVDRVRGTEPAELFSECSTSMRDAAAEIRRLREQRRVAREALEWYADETSWELGPRYEKYSDVDEDCGDRARTALAQLAEPTEVDHG